MSSRSFLVFAFFHLFLQGFLMSLSSENKDSFFFFNLYIFFSPFLVLLYQLETPGYYLFIYIFGLSLFYFIFLSFSIDYLLFHNPVQVFVFVFFTLFYFTILHWFLKGVVKGDILALDLILVGKLCFSLQTMVLAVEYF